MTICADEINYLVRRYLEEMGMHHTAYVFSEEALVNESDIKVTLPPQALITILQKGVLYMQLEKAINQQSKVTNSVEELVRRLRTAVLEGTRVACEPKPALRKVPLPLVGNGPKNTNRSRYQVISAETSQVLLGHSLDVYCGSWTPDGECLATGSADGTVILWQMDGNRYVKRHVLDHTGSADRSHDIVSLSWDSTGTMLATGCSDGTARLWSRSGQLKKVLSKHDDAIFSLQFSPNGKLLLTGSGDKRIMAWDTKTGDLKHVWVFHTSRVMGLSWRDDEVFASCSGDAMVAVCRMGVDEPIQRYKEHKGEVNNIAWNMNGTFLASCSDDKTVRAWPYPSGTGRLFLGHQHHVYTIKWSPTDPRLLVSGAFDHAIMLWDAYSGTCLSTIRQHMEPIYTLCFSPNGNYFISGGIDNVVYIWRASDCVLVASFSTDSLTYEAIWSQTGHQIALCLRNHNVIILNTDNLILFGSV